MKEQRLERIGHLDGWRGIAILLVLIAHFTNFSYFNEGRFGVDIFFVLSGMLMSNILFVKRTPLPLFYWRRASRIVPVFLLFVFSIYTFSYFSDMHFSTTELLSTLAFTRTYLPTEVGIWSSNVPIGHIWSLNVEEHSYIILSLITLPYFIRKKEGYLLILLGIITIFIYIYYMKNPATSPKNYDLRTECAASYIFLSAGYFLIKDRFTPYIKSWFPLMSMMLAVFCYSEIAPWWSSFLVAPFLLAFTVNHLTEAATIFKMVLSFTPLRYLGVWSYSIYLWQQPFYKFKNAFPEGVGLAIALSIGVTSFYLFENPTREWINSLYNNNKKLKCQPSGSFE